MFACDARVVLAEIVDYGKINKLRLLYALQEVADLLVRHHRTQLHPYTTHHPASKHVREQKKIPSLWFMTGWQFRQRRNHPEKSQKLFFPSISDNRGLEATVKSLIFSDTSSIPPNPTHVCMFSFEQKRAQSHHNHQIIHFPFRSAEDFPTKQFLLPSLSTIPLSPSPKKRTNTPKSGEIWLQSPLSPSKTP